MDPSSSLHSSNVPFLWEESPGKPATISTDKPMQTAATQTSPLQLPPKLLFPSTELLLDAAEEMYLPQQTPPGCHRGYLGLAMNQKLLRSITHSPLVLRHSLRSITHSPLLRRSCSFHGSPHHQSPPSTPPIHHGAPHHQSSTSTPPIHHGAHPHPSPISTPAMHHGKIHTPAAAVHHHYHHHRIHIDQILREWFQRTLKHQNQKLATLCKSALKNAWSKPLHLLQHAKSHHHHHHHHTHDQDDGDDMCESSHKAGRDRLFFDKEGPRLTSTIDCDEEDDDYRIFCDKACQHPSVSKSKQRIAPLSFAQMNYTETQRSRRSHIMVDGDSPWRPSLTQKQERIHAWLLSSLRLHDGRDSPSSASSSAMAEDGEEEEEEDTHKYSFAVTTETLPSNREPCPPILTNRERSHGFNRREPCLWKEADPLSSPSPSYSVSGEDLKLSGGHIDSSIDLSSPTDREICRKVVCTGDRVQHEVGAQSPWPWKLQGRVKKAISEKGRFPLSSRPQRRCTPRFHDVESLAKSSSTSERKQQQEKKKKKQDRGRRGDHGSFWKEGEGGGSAPPWPWMVLELGPKEGHGRRRRPSRAAQLVKEAVASKIGGIRKEWGGGHGDGDGDGGHELWAPALATYLYYESQKKKQSILVEDDGHHGYSQSQSSSFRLHLDKFPFHINHREKEEQQKP